MKLLKNKFLLLFFFFGILIRLIFAFLTAHPDLWALFISQNLFVFKGVLNIYDHLANLPNYDLIAKNYGTNFFTYPPLTYYLLGFFGFIFKPFLSYKNYEWILENYPNIYGSVKIMTTVLMFKIPYLLFDLGIAFLLTDFFTDFKKKKMSFILWLANPLAIYTSFMIGQFDIMPVFFVMLALWFIMKKNSLNWGAICLGIGGGLKMFPLFFLPFAVILGKNIKEKLKVGILGILPYLITISPFLFSSAFRTVCLFSRQSQKMLHMTLPVSGAENIYIFVFLFFFLFLYASYRKIYPSDLWRYFLIVLLLFFSATHYHPQWFLWLTPFLALELIESNFKQIWLVLVILGGWLFITLTFEPSLSYGLFVPIFPELPKTSSLTILLSRWFDVFQLRSLVRSIFAGTAFFYGLSVWRDLRDKKE